MRKSRTNPAAGPYKLKTHETKPSLGGLGKIFRIYRKDQRGSVIQNATNEPKFAARPVAKRDERTQVRRAASSKTRRTNPSSVVRLGDRRVETDPKTPATRRPNHTSPTRKRVHSGGNQPHRSLALRARMATTLVEGKKIPAVRPNAKCAERSHDWAFWVSFIDYLDQAGRYGPCNVAGSDPASVAGKSEFNRVIAGVNIRG